MNSNSFNDENQSEISEEESRMKSEQKLTQEQLDVKKKRIIYFFKKLIELK